VSRKDQQQLEELVRNFGAPPRVDALVSEVRSDFVPILPPPQKPHRESVLGAIVVQWEFSLPNEDVQEFHNFLRKSEKVIADAVKKTMLGAHYCGTYMQLAEGEAHYRTIWSYDSLDALAKSWNVGLKQKNSPFYKAVKQLRAYWLRDPQRVEGRYAPAANLHDPRKEVPGDAFGRLTLEASKLNPKRR